MAIYLFFRSDTLWIFEYLQINFIKQFIFDIRIFFEPFKSKFPNWALNALPDGLWVFSALLFLLAIWDFKITSTNFIFIFFIPSIALASEFLQFLGLLIGYFDYKDVFFYCLGICFALLISKPKLLLLNIESSAKLQQISILSILLFYFIAISFFDFQTKEEPLKIDYIIKSEQNYIT